MLEGKKVAASKIVERVTIADTALEASFEVSELIAMKIKPHTIEEDCQDGEFHKIPALKMKNFSKDMPGYECS